MFEIIPKGRDAKAKAFYLFASWHLRCNRYDIERRIKREWTNLMIYGTTHPETIRRENG